MSQLVVPCVGVPEDETQTRGGPGSASYSIDCLSSPADADAGESDAAECIHGVREPTLKIINCCDICGEPDSKHRCSQCKLVIYCGRECQTKGWEEHKAECDMLCEVLIAANHENVKSLEVLLHTDLSDVFPLPVPRVSPDPIRKARSRSGVKLEDTQRDLHFTQQRVPTVAGTLSSSGHFKWSREVLESNSKRSAKFLDKKLPARGGGRG